MSIEVGTRVRMANPGEDNGIFGVTPDLGEGTVVATDGDHLMSGLYVEVDWDNAQFNRRFLRYPSIQSLEEVPS